MSESGNNTGWQFPIIRALCGFASRTAGNWKERHQLPFNFWIHIVGIPLAAAGLVLLFIEPWWGVAGLALGYLLQYIGHLAEGNDVGEWGAVKRLLGLPTVAISPRWQQPRLESASQQGNPS